MAYYVKHRIQQGETLQSIATAKLGNVDEWTTLVRLNHLDFPYIVKTHKEEARGLMNKDRNGVADPRHWVTFGDTINLPLNNGYDQNSVQHATKTTPKERYDATLGMDLHLNFSPLSPKGGVNYGDQAAYLAPSKKGNDVAVVKGTQNLLQSLTLRLITEKGTLPYHPQYGSLLNDYIGKPIYGNPRDTAQDISLEIERAINTDGRVENCKVKKCRLIDEDFFALVSVTPVSPNSTFSMYVDSIQGSYIDTGLIR